MRKSLRTSTTYMKSTHQDTYCWT